VHVPPPHFRESYLSAQNSDTAYTA